MLSFREVKVSFTKDVILDLDLRDCYAREGRWAKNVRMNVKEGKPKQRHKNFKWFHLFKK